MPHAGSSLPYAGARRELGTAPTPRMLDAVHAALAQVPPGVGVQVRETDAGGWEYRPVLDEPGDPTRPAAAPRLADLLARQRAVEEELRRDARRQRRSEAPWRPL